MSIGFLRRGQLSSHASISAFVDASDEAGIDLLSLDTRVVQDGLEGWFSPVSWFSAKQEVALPASPAYGDMVAR